MKLPIVLKDKYTLILFALSFVILAFAFSIAYVNLSDANSLMVVHFDSYRGVDFFGAKSDVYNILTISLIIWLINLFLTNKFYFRERFLSYALATGTILFMVLILIAVNVIISVN